MTGSQGPAISRRALIGTGLGAGVAVLAAANAVPAHAAGAAPAPSLSHISQPTRPTSSTRM
ncbi:hypothetical protein ACTAE5_25095, partial [Streptomyces antibioticus]